MDWKGSPRPKITSCIGFHHSMLHLTSRQAHTPYSVKNAINHRWMRLNFRFCERNTTIKFIYVLPECIVFCSPRVICLYIFNGEWRHQTDIHSTFIVICAVCALKIYIYIYICKFWIHRRQVLLDNIILKTNIIW